MTGDLLWPRYANPGDLAVIEAVPLEDRGLPQTTYALLTRAATLWPERSAVTVLPAGRPLDRAAAAHFRRVAGRRAPLRQRPARARRAPR